MAGDTQLSPHFTLSELTVSEWASRNGVPNVPNAKERNNLVRLCITLERVRDLVGGPIIVTSGYRSPTVNAGIGGSTTSAHMSGLAADIHTPGLTHKALAKAIAKSDIAFDQLILEFDGWVHLGLSTGTPRRQVLTIRRGTGYMQGIV